MTKWWDDIQDNRVRLCKQKIRSWQRMKKRLVDFYFIRYFTYIQVQTLREEIDMGIDNKFF